MTIGARLDMARDVPGLRAQRLVGAVLAGAMAIGGCEPAGSSPPASATIPSPAGSVPVTARPTGTPAPTRIEHVGDRPVVTGEPIDISTLSGRIVFDDFADVYTMNVDGSDLVVVADDPAGPEFDGAWSPDGEWIVYRDSARGINENDEIFVARADGTDRRNISNDPANDWGPDWSPDGSTIVFNSDRDGGRLAGFLMDPVGSNVRRLELDAWVEYPAYSPDGTRIAFMGNSGNNYELYVADLASGAVTRLTNSPGHDAWPTWSPDGATIAFSSHRDDCAIAPADRECWHHAEPGDQHTDVWLISPDGSNLRRVTPEAGQFMVWSPDGAHLLISGHGLFVVRPDGTGRLELRADAIALPLGGIPDWR